MNEATRATKSLPKWTARRTGNLGAWVTRPIKEKAVADAERLGFKSVSMYVSALVSGEVTADRVDGVEAQTKASVVPLEARVPIAVAAHLVVAIDSIKRRVETCADCGPLLAEMTALRKEIAAFLVGSRRAYDDALDARNEARWG